MSEHRSVILLGGGGHAAVVADAARSHAWAIIGYLDDAPGHASARGRAPGGAGGPPGLVRLGAIKDLRKVLAEAPRDALIHAAVGDPGLRRAWLEGISRPMCSPIIHASASVSSSAVIGEGAFVGPLAVINARAQVGRGAIVNSGAIVEHDCRLGAFCHIAPGARLAGDVSVGEDTLVGVGASVHPGVRIGSHATIGVGAAVVEDIEDEAVAMGVPARVVVSRGAAGAAAARA